jgi:hypothetical protein
MQDTILAAWLIGQTAPVYGAAFTILIFLFVILPAIWSRRADRREAAFRVLDRILRFLR